MKKHVYLDMDGTMAMIYKDPYFLTNMYKEGFFKSLEPYFNMVFAVKTMISLYKEKHNNSDGLELEFYILSRKNESEFCETDKNQWIDMIIPEIPKENRIFVDCDKEKTDYIKNLNGDCLLIDDHTPNLLSWVSSGGKGIKFINEINRQHNRWKGNLIHYQMNPTAIIKNVILSL